MRFDICGIFQFCHRKRSEWFVVERSGIHSQGTHQLIRGGGGGGYGIYMGRDYFSEILK